MIFQETLISGAWLVDLKKIGDDRGFFARAWCEKEFADHGITQTLTQANNSFNAVKGTLRGMHFQKTPHEEMKAVRCISGGIFDVAVDLRPDSPSYLQWYGAELTAENRTMLCVPEGCAHGFQTLEDATEVFYLVTAAYNSDSEAGVRWDDPTFKIKWPLPVSTISPKDSEFPDYKVVR